MKRQEDAKQYFAQDTGKREKQKGALVSPALCLSDCRFSSSKMARTQIQKTNPKSWLDFALLALDLFIPEFKLNL